MLSVLQEMISPDNPDIPDIRSKLSLVYCRYTATSYFFKIVAAFKVLAPNKNKAQERLAKLKRKPQDNK